MPHPGVSPDGPVTVVSLRNWDALRKDAVKEYPLGLAHLGRGGNVIVLILVHADGTVGNSLIETSSGYPPLDSATLRILGKAEIEPRSIDGQPVESWQILELTWRADDGPWDSPARLNVLPRSH